MGKTNPREWHAIDEITFASLQLYLVRMGCIEGSSGGNCETYLVAIGSNRCTWSKEVLDMA